MEGFEGILVFFQELEGGLAVFGERGRAVCLGKNREADGGEHPWRVSIVDGLRRLIKETDGLRKTACSPFKRAQIFPDAGTKIVLGLGTAISRSNRR